MSDRDEDYIETFLSELENYDYTINRKKVVISVVKHYILLLVTLLLLIVEYF